MVSTRYALRRLICNLQHFDGGYIKHTKAFESVTICIKTLAEYQDCISLREKKSRWFVTFSIFLHLIIANDA